MPQKVSVELVLEDKLSKQFQEASKNVQGETKKMTDNTTAATTKTKANFLEMGANAKEFGQSLSTGNIPGAVMAFGRLTVGTFKSIGMEMAIATGGLSLLAAGVAMYISKLKDAEAERKKLNEMSLSTMEKFDLRRQELEDAAADKNRSAKMMEQTSAKKRLDEDLKLIKEYSDSENKIIGERYNKGEITAQAARNARITLNAQTEEAIKNAKLVAQQTATETEQKNINDFEQWKEDRAYAEVALVNKIHDEFEAKERKRLDAEMEVYNAAVEDRTAAIQREYNMRKEIQKAEKEYTIANLDSAGSIIGSLGQINQALKGNAEASRALAIGETIINTASAVMKATSQTGVLAPLVIPAIIAQGAAQLAVISAQKFAKGGDFVTSGPQMIMVGDNPGGRERVSVTPLSSPNYNGPQGGASIHMGDIHINGNADASTVRAFGKTREQQIRDLKRIMREMIAARQMPAFA